MMFGSVAVPVPDLDRTDFLLMLGANPYASNGSLCTAPDFPGRLEADSSPRRHRRVCRSAPQRDRHRGRPAPRHPAGNRCPSPGRGGEHAPDRGARRPGTPDRPHQRPRRPGDGRGAVHAGVGGAGVRRRGDDDPHPRPPAGGGTDGCGIRADRHVHAGVRHAGLVAGRRRQPADRQPRPRRRGDVLHGRRRAAVHEGQARQRARAQDRARREPRRGPSGGLRRVPGHGPSGGDRDRRRRQGQGADHRRRQPGLVEPQLRAVSTPPSPRSSSWCASTRTSTRPPATPT